jgi:hypothetical protein
MSVLDTWIPAAQVDRLQRVPMTWQREKERFAMTSHPPTIHPSPISGHFTRIFAASILAFGIAGCAGMTPTQQRMTSGTLIGAGGGAVIGALAGNAAMGAGIGAAAGLAGGYLYQKYKENQAETYAEGYRQGQASAQSKKKQKKTQPQ